ncbi:MAG: IS3 family transposase, partial [Acidobacteria bacterium]|nr:IS3 family transposase [Acidobacteriota bacterium]
QQKASEADMPLRDLIQQVALEWPSYGYRRITAELCRRGQCVNRKLVLRLMREDNLLCLRKRRFVHTTDSDHRLPVYPNIVPELIVTKCDQLWVSDITYIRLLREFIYLAVILDAFSRRVIGWALGRYLETEPALAALRMALSARTVTPGLVHHSDRGVQYASIDYTSLLKEHQVRISMSRRGNAYDNARAESFMKTLKYEGVYLREYETIDEARACISHFLEAVYNQNRLHSALGYLPPVEFEQLNIQPVSP